MVFLKTETTETLVKFFLKCIYTLLTSITFFQPCQPIGADKAREKAPFFNPFLVFYNAR
jgi:hypothetical protein